MCASRGAAAGCTAFVEQLYATHIAMRWFCSKHPKKGHFEKHRWTASRARLQNRRARAESQTATNKSQTAAEPDCRSSAVWLLVVAVWLMFKEPDCNSQENRPQNRARLQHLAAVWLFLQSGSGFWLFLQSGYTTRVVVGYSAG